jgi:hypothetical protein
MEDVKRSKAELMLDVLNQGYHKWVVWMDADSTMIRHIDEVFKGHYDIGLVAKPVEAASSRFGRYAYSGFVVAHNTSQAVQFLKRWHNECHKPGVQSDQKRLNKMLELDLDDQVEPNQILSLEKNDVMVKWLDPDIYVHCESIRQMVPAGKHVKVLHFKGVLHDYFRYYRKHFL